MTAHGSRFKVQGSVLGVGVRVLGCTVQLSGCKGPVFRAKIRDGKKFNVNFGGGFKCQRRLYHFHQVHVQRGTREHK